ncbi:hypothetical protein JCGZ_16087 [Jatropha curcas]|uniref:Receptor-like serine/threonine-protein kinase n=2 Tax=Jatropha curcas TaxID=180498 RepID=A0A067LB09_JATCU|nr:hypothetical protein JCGZ_16087 [Jatropha curcas]
MANRDTPVNGRRSKLSLQKTGNLILTDAGQSIVWATNTASVSSMKLQLHNNGNLVLQSMEGDKLWQSFDSPTNTLLPQQPLTKNVRLVSSRSQTDISSGYYKLLFHQDNILFLVFDGPETSSVYWPDPWLLDDQIDRSRYNDSKIAVFDDKGHFLSSDGVKFRSLDYGKGPYRRLTLDFDGNLRLYSLEEENRTWSVTWHATSKPCRIHGACGPNSICIYDRNLGRKCTCPPRFKMKNQTDWSYGCEPEFKIPCKKKDVGFVKLHHVDFYGYNIHLLKNYTFAMCKETCLNMCNCKGFQHKFIEDDGHYNCYPKRELRNGHLSANFNGTLHLKFRKSEISSLKGNLQEFQLNCSIPLRKNLNRSYDKKGGNGSLKILLWCASVVGWIEVVSISVALLFIYRTRLRSEAANKQGYFAIATRFRRFSYAELKRATCDFSKEIGRGGAGVVYKGVLPDQRIAAIKRLNEANQGEEEFLAEISTIGRLNHMNLIDMWGYCAERSNRLLVYEYMENGSLADNLMSNVLDWEKGFDIAVGIAKGLAYLHEECLEWVLHCDVKPQNILLDTNFQPKVADFGLSKILNRDGTSDLTFSRIRGTRGYMAPEWILNLPITSKVDVYSYGMVVLEMATGNGFQTTGSEGVGEHQGLVARVREKKYGAESMAVWIQEIVDPAIGSQWDMNMLEILIEVAMQCVEEDKDVRPTMSQVVEMLLRHT